MGRQCSTNKDDQTTFKVRILSFSAIILVVFQHSDLPFESGRGISAPYSIIARNSCNKNALNISNKNWTTK
jgi:hypothetical protein